AASRPPAVSQQLSHRKAGSIFGELMSTEVVMPQMGESIAEGTITKWLKQVGDRVERDEPLFEISTDKVDAEIPSPAAGTLTEIRFKEGDTVEINTTVAVLDGGAAAPAKGEVASEAVPTVAAPATTEPAAPPPAKPADVAPPQAQVEASAATGAEVQPADKTAPAVSEKPEKPSEEAKDTAQPPAVKSSSTENGRSAGSTAEELRRTKSSPLVRRIAEEHGVDIAGVEGTGMS